MQTELNCKVIYYTKTGHSRKIAQSIASVLHTQAEDIRANPALNDVDLLFIVGGIYGGVSDPAMIAYINTIDASTVRKAALLTSCAGKTQKQDQIRSILTRKQIKVVPDEFLCQGGFLFFGFKHPDQEDLNKAVAFAENVLSDFQISLMV